MKTKMPIGQLTAWLIVAISAPVLSLAGRVDWLSAVITFLICIAVGCGVLFIDAQTPKWVRGLELAWAILFLGTIARESASCWSDGAEVSLLPALLIVSATFAVRNGAQYGARSGAALLWIVLPGVLVVLLAGMGEVNVKYFSETSMSNIWLLVPMLLLPILGRHMAIDDKRKLTKPLLLGGALSIASVAWLTASMPSQVLTNAQNTFYEYSKGITLFGVAERFEAVSACLLTFGWFALFSFLSAVVYELLEEGKSGFGRLGIWCCSGVAILVMYNLPITLTLVGFLTLIFWGFLPFLTQAVGALRKLKKRRKIY